MSQVERVGARGVDHEGGAAAVQQPAAADGEAAGALDREPHPWRRYVARMFDVALLGTIASIPPFILLASFDEAAAMFIAEGPFSTFLILPVLSWLVSLPLIAFCHARWGATPGKWLCGLRVARAEGGRLGFSAALGREARLAVTGAGLGLPLVSLLCLVNSYSQLENAGETGWDRATAAVSLARPAGAVQIAGTLFAVALLVALRAFEILSVAAEV